MLARSIPAILALAVPLACATPIGVERVDARDVHRELTASVLSTGEPSSHSKQALERLGLAERFDEEPGVVLAELHDGLSAEMLLGVLFALAELSFLQAERTNDRSRFLAAAVYAWAFLVPEDNDAGTHALDPRLRVAADLYNRALTEALTSPEDEEVRLEGGRRTLPFGELEIALDDQMLRWAGYPLVHFMPVAEFRVRGLRNRYRRAGIGAPLAARLAPPDAEGVDENAAQVAVNLKVPVTALLRLEQVRSGLRSGRLRGRLELYSEYATPSVRVGRYEVPLEYETTAALAYSLEGSPVWDMEIAGFRQADSLRELLVDRPRGLIMLSPYTPGRIPVVLVHGTASSSARWAEMLNELMSYPEIRERYQFWFFHYATGQPILYSARLLRDALVATIAELDPAGRDDALRRMIVVGHSQGGLLTRLQVTDSGNRFWDTVSNVPFDELDLDAETRDLVGPSVFFEPLPFVERVVFVSTPHRGSYLARGILRRLVNALVSVPTGIASASVDLVQTPGARFKRRLDRVPSSVDNMDPSHPFTLTLSSLPIADGVVVHSIIPVRGDGPLEEENDGVVEYKSAHLEDVASELVVPSGHSAQGHPKAIREMRRILLEHLAAE